jgi:hypothetical protein
VRDNIGKVIHWRLVYLEERKFRLILNTLELKHIEIEFEKEVFAKEFV